MNLKGFCTFAFENKRYWLSKKWVWKSLD